MFLRNSKLIMILMITSLFLAACGGSIEKDIIGSWKLINDGEVGMYWEFDEERLLARESSEDNRESLEYILTETTDDNFSIEIIEPSNGELQLVFEGYFEDEDTIEPMDNPDGAFEIIRVDNIAEDMAEQKEKD